jgi:hypothetical protein
MFNNTFKILYSLILGFGICYIILSFLNWTFNAGDWNGFSRFCEGFFGVILSGLIKENKRKYMKKIVWKRILIDTFWVLVILYSISVLITVGYENRILLYKINGSYINQLYRIFIAYTTLSLAYIILSTIYIIEKIEKYFE